MNGTSVSKVFHSARHHRDQSPRTGAGRCIAGAAAFALIATACSSAPPPISTVQIVSTAPERSACKEGAGNCDGRADNACETNLASSPAHCGACGHACNEGEACALGACVRAPVLALSSTQGCVVAPSGKLRCWGTFQKHRNADLGDVSDPESAVATLVPGAEDVIAVRSSPSESCAVLRSGRLRCWSNLRSHELDGYGAAVDVSLDLPCALQANGTVACAGTDDDWNPIIKPLAGLHDALALTTSANFACALRKSDAVACWGRLTRWPSGDYETTVTQMPGLTDVGHLASFGDRACAVRRSGQIACWGGEVLRQDDPDLGVIPLAINVPGVVDAVEVAVGKEHTCALRRSGEVTCWGKNTYGQLGDGSRRSSDAPVAVRGLTDAIHVAAGRDVSCAMRRSGAVVCWGSALRGGLGNGITASAITPVEVEGVSEVDKIALGSGYSCALHRDGKVSCWGRGSSGEGDRVDAASPWTIPALDDATALLAGTYRLCAVRKNGEVVCVRSGVPAWTDLAAPGNTAWKPARIEGLGAVRALSSFEQTGVALRPSGAVDIVSIHAGSDPGDGPLVAEVRSVPGLRDAIAVASSSSEACALRRGGAVACFGFSRAHTFGENPVAPTAIVEASGPRDVERIFAANGELFAARKGGKLSRLAISFPNNAHGFKPPQLGPTVSIKPRSSGRTPPVIPPKKGAAKRDPSVTLEPFEAIEGAVDLARGYHQMRSSSVECLLLASGQVRCDGDGSFGQLGHAGESNDAPVQGLSDGVAIAVGTSHACAVRKNGRVVCWGDDLDDEVGRSVRAYSTTPVAVQGLDR